MTDTDWKARAEAAEARLTVTDEMVERGIDAAIRANRPSVEYRNRDQREADEDTERPRYRALVRAALTAALENKDG